MSFCIFNQQRHRADVTQNTTTSPMLLRKLQPKRRQTKTTMRIYQTLLALALIHLIACNSNNNSTTKLNEFDTTVSPTDIKPSSIPISKDTLTKLQNKNSVTVGPLTLKFGKFSQAKEFIFDRYPTYSGTEWRLYTAERGNKYLIANVDITSTDKDPNLPCIFLYKFDNGSLSYVGTFDFKLYRWEDYATYLGNYHDNHNDFKYQSTVKFSIGYQEEETTLNGSPLFVLVKKENTIYRTEERFDNPPVSYSSSPCSLTGYTSLDTKSLGDFEVVAILNKDKLK